MIRLLIFLFIFLNCPFAKADDKVQITSTDLIFNKKDQTAIFEGNVKIYFEDQFILTDKIIIHYSILNKGEIIKISFPQAIKAIKGDKDIIIADYAEYDNKAKKLTLSGNVWARKDDNVLVTNIMIYYVKLKTIKQPEN